MTLHALAEAAGLTMRWKDVHGYWHDVSDDTARTVLAALGLPAATDAEVADSLAHLHDPARLPPLVTADAGGVMHLPVSGPYAITLEAGSTVEGVVGEGGAIPIPAIPGYHRLTVSGAEMVLAVAPARCWSVVDAVGGRSWGLAVQLYSLRRAGDGGIGDFGGLADFVRAAARHGAQAVAISPVHAQFTATPDRFSPYAPSSRTWLNVLHANVDVAGASALEDGALVDWPASTALRLAAMDRQFDAGSDSPDFAAFRAAGGVSLQGHAVFEALHAFQLARGEPWYWRHWGGGLADHASAAVAEFARDHEREVSRHAFRQFLAERGLGAAQEAAINAGMKIGLVTDLAVGVDGGGSQCWAHPDETLLGLSVGAPPDLLNTRGQGWGIVAFSPHGLRKSGYRGFINMLRAAMRHAGGVRIDHAMGLARLWVLPDGASPGDGVYLRFPIDDMLRLVRLESLRHRAVVLGEDLGTLPEGFQARIADSGMLGMRVVWFERALDGGFTAPAGWDHGSASMTSTHDLATVAGWWTGRDTDWRRDMGLLDEAGALREGDERARDRDLLWSAMVASGSAEGPTPAEPDPAVDAAARHIAAAGCDLAVLPIEDALGLVDQPNFPGTTTEHPNWRRRMPGQAADLLDAPQTAARLSSLAARTTTA